MALPALFFTSLQCRCHPGFRLKDDGKVCVDIDECTTTYPCTQHCINTHGSFHCLCVEGYQLSPENPTICKSTSGKKRDKTNNLWQVFVLNPFTHDVSLPAEEEPFLIFANRYYLRKLNLDGSNYTLLKQVGLAWRACAQKSCRGLLLSQTNAAPCGWTGLEQCCGFGLRLSPADDLLDRCHHPGQHDPTDVHQRQRRSGQCDTEQ